MSVVPVRSQITIYTMVMFDHWNWIVLGGRIGLHWCYKLGEARGEFILMVKIFLFNSLRFEV